MSNIRVVDARMGRGKTSAAFAYMSANKGRKRFIYITPYLKEVSRVCESCDFEQPDSDHSTKLSELKALLHQKKNVATTHSLFYLMDEDVLSMVKEFRYSIIIDESIETVRKIQLSSKDTEIILDVLTEEGEDGRIIWKDKEYSGKFDECKEMADSGMLYRFDSSLISVMRPEILEAFDEVIMMTYLFGGQYQKAYLDYFGFEYKICGIDSSNGFMFTDSPDNPPGLDYRDLITIIDDEKYNAVGDKKFALSKNWFERRGYDNPDIKKLRYYLNLFYRGKSGCPADKRIWTTFKNQLSKLDYKDNRFRASFVQLSERATNEYRSRDHVAYLANRFIDPNIKKFFASKNIEVDDDEFALGEMLQFIWRSSIRDDKPIILYIPSSRMRGLLIGWINRVSKGGCDDV